MVEAKKVLFWPRLDERSPIDVCDMYTKGSSKSGCDQALTKQ